MDRIRSSFARQGLMRTLGATLESGEPGTVTIGCDFSEHVTQPEPSDLLRWGTWCRSAAR